MVKNLINIRNIDRAHNFSLANRAATRVTPHNPNHHIAESFLLRLPYIVQTSKPALSHLLLSNKISLGAGQSRLKKICEFFVFLIFCCEPNCPDGNYKCHGLRIGRVNILLACSSLMNSSLSGSHLSLRPSLMAISSKWQMVSERTAVSMGQIVFCLVLTQSMKLRR